MSASISDLDNSPERVRVSVIARLIAAIAYTIVALGGAAGSFLLFNLFRELRTSETAGIAAVMIGMKEASLPVTVSFYLAAFVVLVVVIVLIVRMFVQTRTASPPFWFFALGAVLCLIPAALFWRAEHLVIAVLSPGSGIEAAGISGVASDLSRLLMFSIASAPIVFIILVALSVLPFKSRPGQKWGSLIVSILVAIIFVGTAIAFPYLVDGPKRKSEMVALPANTRAADEDGDIDKAASVVITLTADNKLYRRQSSNQPDNTQSTDTLISKDQLSPAIETGIQSKSPDKRIVYLKCDAAASYENVLQVFDAIRNADVDKVGLVVTGKKDEDDPYRTAPLEFEVRLPASPNDRDSKEKPNPLTIDVRLSDDGKVTLNNESMGTLSDTSKLVDQLGLIFKQREHNGVFREDSNDIEKTVFVEVPKSSKYGDLIRLIEAVKLSGAHPIGIQMGANRLPVFVN